MSKKTKQKGFEHTESLSNIELASRLIAIADGLKKGVLHFSSESDSVNLQPAPLGKIELKASQKKRSGSITIALSWKNKKEELVEELLDLAKLDADLFDALLLELSTNETHPEVSEAVAEVKEELGGKAAKNGKTVKNGKAKKAAKAAETAEPTLADAVATAIESDEHTEGKSKRATRSRKPAAEPTETKTAEAVTSEAITPDEPVDLEAATASQGDSN